MKTQDVKVLIELFKDSDIMSLEVSDKHGSVRISRQQEPLPAATPPVIAAPAAAVAMAPASNPAAVLAPNTADETITMDISTAADLPEGNIVLAPMVGTVYLAPNPDADDFVSLGQTVNTGDTLCLIEAMKMFNKIESEYSGKIVKCLVENGQPVEFNQPLFIITND